MEKNPTRLITMDSYLICKCGGIISIVEDGSEFQEYCDGILQVILDFIDRFIADCEWKIERNAILADPELEPPSYEKAIRVLKAFKTILDNTGEDVVLEDAILLELISHSYEVEMGKRVWAFATVLVGLAGSKTLSLLYGGVQFVSAVVDKDVASAVSGEVSLKSDLYIDGEKPLVSRANSWYSNFTTLLDLFYRSDDTWLETIKITVFSNNGKEGTDTTDDDFAHIGRCKMDKVHKLVDGSDLFKIQLKDDYVQTAEWETTAIAQVLTKEHMGETNTKVINKNEDVNSAMNPENN